MSTSKPRILVTRAIFQSVIDRLSAHFEVESNPDDVLWDRAELLRRMQGKVGVFATGTIGWIHALDATSWGDEKVSAVVRGMTTNVLQAFASGPAGVAHPRVSNACRYRSSVQPAGED